MRAMWICVIVLESTVLFGSDKSLTPLVVKSGNKNRIAPLLKGK